MNPEVLLFTSSILGLVNILYLSFSMTAPYALVASSLVGKNIYCLNLLGQGRTPAHHKIGSMPIMTFSSSDWSNESGIMAINEKCFPSYKDSQ